MKFFKKHWLLSAAVVILAAAGASWAAASRSGEWPNYTFSGCSIGTSSSPFLVLGSTKALVVSTDGVSLENAGNISKNQDLTLTLKNVTASGTDMIPIILSPDSSESNGTVSIDFGTVSLDYMNVSAPDDQMCLFGLYFCDAYSDATSNASFFINRLNVDLSDCSSNWWLNALTSYCKIHAGGQYKTTVNDVKFTVKVSDCIDHVYYPIISQAGKSDASTLSSVKIKGTLETDINGKMGDMYLGGQSQYTSRYNGTAEIEVNKAKLIIRPNGYVDGRIFGSGRTIIDGGNDAGFDNTKVSTSVGSVLMDIYGGVTGNIYVGGRTATYAGADWISRATSDKVFSKVTGDSGVHFYNGSLVSGDIFAGGLEDNGSAAYHNAIVSGNVNFIIDNGALSGFTGTITGDNDADSTVIFNSYQGAFAGTLKSVDIVEVAPGAAVTGLSTAKFDAKTIKLTGNWANYGSSTALTFTDSAKAIAIDISGALGVKSAAWSADGKSLVVKCENTPVAVTPVTLSLEVGKTDTVKATTSAKGETVTWSTSDKSIATVDANGTVTAVKAGLAVITATGSASETAAGCIVTVTDTANPDPVPSPVPVDTKVVSSADNPVVKDTGVPAEVKVADPAVVAATKDNVAAMAKSADVAADFFAATADGKITVSPVVAKAAVTAVISDDTSADIATIKTMPVITTTVETGKVAALAVKVSGTNLGATANSVVSDVNLIKILGDKSGAKFSYVADPTAYADKTFTIKNADGKSLALTDGLDAATEYTLVIFVKDNGAFDLDKADGSIIDPLAIATKKATEPTPTSGGSSGGCNAGMFGFVLVLLAAPLYARKRK